MIANNDHSDEFSDKVSVLGCMNDDKSQNSATKSKNPGETNKKSNRTESTRNYSSFGPPSVVGKNVPPNADPSIFTRNGGGLIDFILACQPGGHNATQKLYREIFESKLRKEGLYMETIRLYFGVKVGIYFAWLGFYTKMLVPLTILGLIVFLYGIHSFETFVSFVGKFIDYYTIARDEPMLDVCHSDLGNLPICRRCSYGICKFTRLKNSCTAAKANAVFNNYATMVIAFLSSIWAIAFLELWKREQSRLACKWDTFDVEMDYEPPRPEYQAAATDMRRNPITQEPEAYILSRNLKANTVLSTGTVIFMICIVLSVISAVILYKVGMVIVFYNWHHPVVAKIGAATAASLTASLIGAVCIMSLEKVYGKIAWKMTEMEYPRTDADFEASYTYKMFIFQFINYYATLFSDLPKHVNQRSAKATAYILQGNMSSDPTHDMIFTDRCPPTGCMFSVTTQLFIVQTVKQVMQFGFVTLFVAAFPLAPLFALLNNIVEKRLDANKFLGQARRVLPYRAANIGSWYGILEAITKLAVLTNALLIAFTTDLLDRIIYTVVYSKDTSLKEYISFTILPTSVDNYWTGYVNWTLAYFDTNDWYDRSLKNYNGTTIKYCRYRGYYSMPRSMMEREMGFTDWQEDQPFVQETVIGSSYHRTDVWWRIMAVKLFFVILFEHTIFGIPDIPEEVNESYKCVNLHVQRNRHLAKFCAKILAESKQKEKEEKEAVGKQKHFYTSADNPDSLPTTAQRQNPIGNGSRSIVQPSSGRSSSSPAFAHPKAKRKKIHFPSKKKTIQPTPSDTASDLQNLL